MHLSYNMTKKNSIMYYMQNVKIEEKHILNEIIYLIIGKLPKISFSKYHFSSLQLTNFTIIFNEG